MNTIHLDNKKYVVITEKEFWALQKKAALKTKPEKTLSIVAARAHSKKRIQQWAKEK